jgi:hypothetical protein
MSHNQELQLVTDSHEKTNHEKILEAYRRLTEKLDILIAKRNKKSKTGT